MSPIASRPPLRLSRRTLIAGSAAAVAAGALRPASAEELASGFGTPQASWKELRILLGQDLYLPQDAGFGLKMQVNNMRYMADIPYAVAVCADAGKAAGVIQWCAANKVPFRIKGGGHSYAGFSAGPYLILYTQGMEDLTWDGTRVTVGAGAINYSVYDALKAKGRTMTHGRCPGVGVAGFALGGGIGFDMRRYGVASDRLAAATAVLADGSQAVASATENPDLFWALRGGAGGNFALSTSFTFETEDVSQEELLVFDMTWQRSTGAEMAELLRNMMQAFEADESRLLGSRISVQYLQPAGDPLADKVFSLNLVGQWAGSGTLAEAFPQLPEPQITGFQFRGPYWDAQGLLEEPEESFFYQERSTFIPSAPHLDALADAMETLRKRPDVHGPCDLRFFQTGGMVNAMDPGATAFVHRSSQWLPLVGFYWTAQDRTTPGLVEEGHLWQDAFYAQIQRDFNGTGAFQNFPDPSLENWAAAYYGSNLPRLQAVKAQYDPGCLFDFPQVVGSSCRPAAPA